MPRFRSALPQLDSDLFLTDGGMETTLVFQEGVELPRFAAFPLLDDARGQQLLRDYYRRYAALARKYDAGLILESVTWRASGAWGERLGYTAEQLADFNRRAIGLLEELREEAGGDRPIVVSGCLGPRGDGYQADLAFTVEAAADYHGEQIRTLAGTGADMICAMTMNAAAEAAGVAGAAQEAGIPVVISFTVETDARLPSGETLAEAIGMVDGATGAYPAYYMINCAHPSHFREALRGEWAGRIRGLRANASRKSHAELDEATDLDSGDPEEFGRLYAELKREMPQLTVIGGCCGTDHRHVDEAAGACAPLFNRKG